MSVRKLLKAVVGVAAMAAVLQGCSLFGGNELTGTATKGPLDGAEISVYTLDAEGSRGEKIAGTTTDSAGQYTVDLGDYSGPVAVVAAGGSYRDEATGETVELKEQELESLLASVGEGQSTAVTALTTIAAQRAAEQAADGLETAISNANQETAAAFGLDDVDISGVVSADLSDESSQDASAAEQAYGAVQAGISSAVNNSGAAAADAPALVQAIAEDFSDGEFDGQNAAGETLETAVELTPEEAMNGLETAIDAFLKSEENRSGLEDVPVTVPVPGAG